MPGREIEVESEVQPHPPGPLVFRSPRNWTAVAFFGALGALHLGMAATALLDHRWESYMSVVFGGGFTLIAVACFMVRHEVVVAPGRRRVMVRTALGRVAVERGVPFSTVTLVRVTLLGRSHGEACVSIVCEREEIEMPPTATPRQQGLLLAVTLGTRLVKVYGDGAPPEAAERIAKLYRNEDAV